MLALIRASAAVGFMGVVATGCQSAARPSGAQAQRPEPRVTPAADHGESPAPSQCAFDQSPPRAVPPPPAACQQQVLAVTPAIRTELTQRYKPTHGGTVEVTFPCDGLGPQIREIVIETGSGHGGTLELWRARLRVDGTYDVHGIVGESPRLRRREPTLPFQIATGITPLPALDRVRAAISARVREIEPPPPVRGTGSVSAWSSSHDFHALVRLTDDEGRVLEQRYTGYESSGGQDSYLGVELALEVVAPIRNVTPERRAASQQDRALFAERFAAAVPHFDDEYAWWVMERYVALAIHLGTPAVIPGLLTRLRVTSAERSVVDARANAVAALAQITGWDAREPDGSIEDAAARYLDSCRAR